MNYSKASEIQKALDFKRVIDGIEYQVKPNQECESSALYFGYEISEVKPDGNLKYFGYGTITLRGMIAEIPFTVEKRIRDKIRDELTPRDCVIPLVLQEMIDVTIALRECGQNAFADKLRDAFSNAEPSP